MCFIHSSAQGGGVHVLVVAEAAAMSGEPLLDAGVPGDRLRPRNAGPAAVLLQDFFAHLFLFGPLRRLADNDSTINCRKPRKFNRGGKVSTPERTSAKLEPNWKT